jgi:hypothetical protein
LRQQRHSAWRQRPLLNPSSRTRRPLRVLTTRAIATVLEQIGAGFERRTGRTLEITTDVARRMVQGRSPDLSSVDAFTRALIAARSAAYLKEGHSGVHVAHVLERLGIAETIRPKLTLPETDIVLELVRRGEGEFGIVVITHILTTDGVCARWAAASRSPVLRHVHGRHQRQLHIDRCCEGTPRSSPEPCGEQCHESPGDGVRQIDAHDRTTTEIEPLEVIAAGWRRFVRR